MFGPDGSHLRTFGGKGAGPGELGDANGMVLRRDGFLWVNDPRNTRLSVFHPESGVVRSTRIEVGSWGWLWDGVVDTAGILWESQITVLEGEQWRLLRGGATFDVFERDGAYAGTVQTPFKIPSWWNPIVRGDRMWTLATDEFDVGYVVRGRLVSAAGDAT